MAWRDSLLNLDSSQHEFGSDLKGLLGVGESNSFMTHSTTQSNNALSTITLSRISGGFSDQAEALLHDKPA